MIEINGEFYASVLYYLGDDNVTKYYKFEIIESVDSAKALNLLNNCKFLDKIIDYSTYPDVGPTLDLITKFNLENINKIIDRSEN